MGIISEVFMWMGIFSGCIVGFFLILNFMMKNLPFTYLRVKASRGKLILTEVASMTDNYYKTGYLEDDVFKYTTRTGKKKVIGKISKRAIRSIMGVFSVKVDETGNFFYMDDGKPPESKDMPDAEAVDNLINRIITAPQSQDILKVVILVVCVLILFACIYIVMKEEAILKAIVELKKVSGVI